VGGSGSSLSCYLRPGGGVQSLRAWNGACPSVSSCWILCAVWNCWRTLWPMSHFATACMPLFVESIWVISFVPALANSWSLAEQWLQKSSMWHTDCVGHPHVHCSVIFGTWMLASHAFRPITFVHNKNVAVDSAFVSPSYRGIVGVVYGVFQVAASYVFVASFQCFFHLRSAHLAINVIDFHLCWWPPVSCRRGSVLLVWRQVSSWCSRNPHISFSLSVACRQRASWLVCL